MIQKDLSESGNKTRNTNCSLHGRLQNWLLSWLRRSLLSCLHNSEDLLVRRTKRAGRVNGENRQTVFTAAGELPVQLTCVKARTKGRELKFRDCHAPSTKRTAQKGRHVSTQSSF